MEAGAVEEVGELEGEDKEVVRSVDVGVQFPEEPLVQPEGLLAYTTVCWISVYTIRAATKQAGGLGMRRGVDLVTLVQSALEVGEANEDS